MAGRPQSRETLHDGVDCAEQGGEQIDGHPLLQGYPMHRQQQGHDAGQPEQAGDHGLDGRLLHLIQRGKAEGGEISQLEEDQIGKADQHHHIGAGSEGERGN